MTLMPGKQVVDEETHKAMLAWHFKKQEQQKVCCPFGTACHGLSSANTTWDLS